MKEMIKEKLTEILKPEAVTENASMAEHTSFRAGGCADLIAAPENTGELRAVLRLLDSEGCPHMILGNGSNILVRDGGYRGVIVKIGDAFDNVRVEGDKVICGAGTRMASVARAALTEPFRIRIRIGDTGKYRRSRIHERRRIWWRNGGYT